MKKIKTNLSGDFFIPGRKYLRIMKLTFIFMLWGLISYASATYSQSTRLTFESDEATIESVFKQIESLSEFKFAYNSSKLDVGQKISLKADHESINVILDKILGSTDFQYKIVDRYIIINDENGKDPTTLVSEQAAKNVKGKVTDSSGAALPGVTVVLKGTTNGVITDSNGNYSINNIPKDASLQFSFVGIKTQEITVGNETTINVTLAEETIGIEEVVAVGYGIQKKVNLTAAVSSVKVDEILGRRPVSTTAGLLLGVVPGLQVGIGSGEPGSSKSFNIRGATDIPATGTGNTISATGPLILVDNVPISGPLNMLDPNDIESISVLKDAGSAAIYGARSGFGVILITTKKGMKNQKMKFNYSNNVILASPSNLPVKANPMQAVQSYKDMGSVAYYTGQDTDTWLQLLNEYKTDPQKYPKGYGIVNGIRYQLAESDVIKDLLGNTALQYQQNMSVSGGSDKTSYRLSFGSVNENGILAPSTKQDAYKRYNIKSVVTSDIATWFTVQLDASYYNSVKTSPAEGFGLAVNLPSYTPTDSIEVNGVQTVNGTPKNRVSLTAPTTDRFDDTRITGRTILRPLKGLTLTAEYTFDNLRRLNTLYNKKFTYTEPGQFVIKTAGTSTFRKINENTDYHSLNLFGNYQKSIKKHNLSFLFGFNQEDNSFEQELVQNTLMISNDLPSISQGTGLITGGDAYSGYSVRGYFGRFNYDYDGTYLLEINGRNDASSKFPEGHRNGFFPSVSVGWRLSHENFMKPLQPILSNLKIRGSLGSVGNQNVGPYQFVPGMSSYYAAWLNAATQVTTLNPPDLVSSSFTWAIVKTLDYGFDFGFFSNKLTGSVDWYKRDTENMLYKGIQLPAVLGTGAPLQNVADLRSEGFELEINWKQRIGNTQFRIGANLYDFQSKITRIQNEAGLLSQYYIGQKLGEFWGYTTDRLFTVDDFVDGTLNSNLTGGTLKPNIAAVQGSLPNPGDIKYKDLNDDGVITPGTSTLSDPGDRSVIGNNTQRYQYGIHGGLDWKNFAFSFSLSGVGKRDLWLANALTFPNFDAFSTIYAHELNYWTPTNTNSYFGRIYDQAGGNQSFNYRSQTKFISNGAYMKVQNLSLAYTLPAKLVKKLHLDKFQLSISIENPFTIDHLANGLDPILNNNDTNGLNYPFMRMTSFGVNVSF